MKLCSSWRPHESLKGKHVSAHSLLDSTESIKFDRFRSSRCSKKMTLVHVHAPDLKSFSQPVAANAATGCSVVVLTLNAVFADLS